MKTHLTIALCLALMAGSALASFSAQVETKVKKSIIEATITVSGLVGCPKRGSVTVRWTAPAGVEGFKSHQYEAYWKACDATGTAHTRAIKTIQKRSRGKTLRAVGTWKVELLSDEKVFASAEAVVAP